MDRPAKLAILRDRADDVRRLALDELDSTARRTSSWGSKEHRAGREKVESDCAQELLRLEKLEEAAMDRELV